MGMDGWRGWCPGGQVDGERGGGVFEGAPRTAQRDQGAVMPVATASFSGDTGRFKWRPCRGGAALCGGGHGHPVHCVVHVVGVCVERAR
jgi:hypothetical protein